MGTLRGRLFLFPTLFRLSIASNKDYLPLVELRLAPHQLAYLNFILMVFQPLPLLWPWLRPLILIPTPWRLLTTLSVLNHPPWLLLNLQNATPPLSQHFLHLLHSLLQCLPPLPLLLLFILIVHPTELLHSTPPHPPLPLVLSLSLPLQTFWILFLAQPSGIDSLWLPPQPPTLRIPFSFNIASKNK